MNRLFTKLIDRNTKDYIDEMLVDSKQAEDHVLDLTVTFEDLRKYNMKLNPHKSSFKIQSERILGFMVNIGVIEINPDQIKTIINTKVPINGKELKRLSKKITTLNRFIRRSTNKYIHFFNLLK